MLLIGWALIGVGGLWIQRKHYPNLLVPAAGKNKNRVYDALKINHKEDESIDNSIVNLGPGAQSPDESRNLNDNVNEEHDGLTYNKVRS